MKYSFNKINKCDSFQNIFDNIVLLFYSTFDTFINFIKRVFQLDDDKKSKKSQTTVKDTNGKTKKISCDPNDIFPFISFSSMFGMLLTAIFLPLMFSTILVPFVVSFHKAFMLSAEITFGWISYRKIIKETLLKNNLLILCILFIIFSIFISPLIKNIFFSPSKIMDPLIWVYSIISALVIIFLAYSVFYSSDIKNKLLPTKE